jgi:hypothetical protein
MGIGLISAILTLFLPGAIATFDGVFYDSGVRNKLPSEAATSLGVFERQRSMLQRSVTSIQTNLDAINDKDQQRDFDFYIHLLDERQQELNNLRPPIFVIGFFLSPQMLLWPAVYTSLGCLLFASNANNLLWLKGNVRRLLYISVLSTLTTSGPYGLERIS